MHVSLTPELEAIVKNKVESGFYNNASEVVREALRFMEMNNDFVAQIKLDRLRSHLAEGERQIETGHGVILKSQQDTREFFAGLNDA